MWKTSRLRKRCTGHRRADKDRLEIAAWRVVVAAGCVMDRRDRELSCGDAELDCLPSAWLYINHPSVSPRVVDDGSAYSEGV